MNKQVSLNCTKHRCVCTCQSSGRPHSSPSVAYLDFWKVSATSKQPFFHFIHIPSMALVYCIQRGYRHPLTQLIKTRDQLYRVTRYMLYTLWQEVDNHKQPISLSGPFEFLQVIQLTIELSSNGKALLIEPSLVIKTIHLLKNERKKEIWFILMVFLVFSWPVALLGDALIPEYKDLFPSPHKGQGLSGHQWEQLRKPRAVMVH